MKEIKISFTGDSADHAFEVFFEWFGCKGQQEFLNYCVAKGIDLTEISGSEKGIEVQTADKEVIEPRVLH